MKIRIDVGANDGGVSIPWLSDPNVIVYAFEPEPDVYKKLLQNSGGNPRYHCINKAVSSSEGIFDFYVSIDPSCSSLLPYTEEGLRRWLCPSQRSLGVKQIIKVEAVSLKNFMEGYQISSVDYLKVDAQGHDLDVLKSAGDRLKSVRELVFEVQTTEGFELYKGSSKLPACLQYMKDMGFALVRVEEYTRNQELNCFFRNETYNQK
jgi:hypothetical protein